MFFSRDLFSEANIRTSFSTSSSWVTHIMLTSPFPSSFSWVLGSLLFRMNLLARTHSENMSFHSASLALGQFSKTREFFPPLPPPPPPQISKILSLSIFVCFQQRFVSSPEVLWTRHSEGLLEGTRRLESCPQWIWKPRASRPPLFLGFQSGKLPSTINTASLFFAELGNRKTTVKL